MATIWLVLFYAWLLTEVLILVVTRTSSDRGKVSDRGSLLLLWLVITASITASQWLAGVTAKYMFSGVHWLNTASLLLLMAGLAIRWTAVLSLGRSFSVNVAVHHDQRVHKTGLFRFVRHPSYLGLMLVLTAIGVRTGNWFSLAVIILLPLAALLYRIHVEEAALSEAFGDEYIDYSKATKRLLPFIY